MQTFQSIILPLCVVIIIVWGLIKKVKVFDCFIEGAKTGVNTVLNILPALCALMVGVSMLRASGALDILNSVLSPVASVFGIPSEVIPLCIMSPLSGSGALAVLEDILKTYGADSYIGRVASVISGASETTFYAISVYYGCVGITKTNHTLPAALTADSVSFIMAALCCKFL